MDKPLFIPLKSEYYDAFADGTKKSELRRYGPRWNENTCRVRRIVTLSKGYGNKNRRHGRIIDFYKVPAKWLDSFHGAAIISIYGRLDIDITVIFHRFSE
ncbi:hypothetical protein [Nitrosomonas sp. Nm166]|uniref:hypothetical protein n=1 Tax=Nitrosomonas sp. Nm166 TaxID=1881054 RepID=UPI0008EDCD08|nr:hypothetical protein [Nitrosomonas sp. Nm166]SFF27671.1 hypothetical protein SAMN05428977_11012 [Nitrosomonas sp. Nm166]